MQVIIKESGFKERSPNIKIMETIVERTAPVVFNDNVEKNIYTGNKIMNGELDLPLIAISKKRYKESNKKTTILWYTCLNSFLAALNIATHDMMAEILTNVAISSSCADNFPHNVASTSSVICEKMIMKILPKIRSFKVC